MELKTPIRSTLEGIFRSFDEQEVTYVVLRKYDGIPESVIDEDIDLLIQADDFDTALEICSDRGFTNTHTLSRDLFDLGKRAITKPGEAIWWIRNRPKQLLGLVSNTTKPYEPGSHGYRCVKLKRGGLLLDTKSHLAYRSPMNDERIRVHPFVESKLFERRRERKCFHTPSPPDELAHIVCHCIFDKVGHFSDYYRGRCDALVATVRSSNQTQRQFEELLEYLFFDAADLVKQQVYGGNYETILEDLYRFDNY